MFKYKLLITYEELEFNFLVLVLKIEQFLYNKFSTRK